MDDALRIALDAGLRFTGLREFTVDERLWHYVPLRMALELRVVPVTLIGDRLELACAVPDPDLGRLRRHFPALTIAIVIAPATEIARVLDQAQGTDA